MNMPSYGEEAILQYEQYYYDNKLIFTGSGGGQCDVESVFR